MTSATIQLRSPASPADLWVTVILALVLLTPRRALATSCSGSNVCDQSPSTASVMVGQTTVYLVFTGWQNTDNSVCSDALCDTDMPGTPGVRLYIEW